MIAQFLFSATSPAAPGTVVSSAPVANAASFLPVGVAGPLEDYESGSAIFDVAANTSGGTLSCVLQTSPDGGRTWADFIRAPTIANAHAAIIYSAPFSLAVTTTAPIAVGEGTTPALAANTIVGGAFSDRMRLVMIAGTGASSGVAILVRLLMQRKRIRELGG
jgi:hypothetical protein